MLRKLLATGLVAGFLSAVPASAGTAIQVHVRVEGKTATIFGAAEPRIQSSQSALTALETASVTGEFYYHVTQSSFGQYVDQIGRYKADATGGWVYKINGAQPPVGADQPVLKAGDRVLWYWTPFSRDGVGQPTLQLVRTSRNCYRVLSVDDRGVRTAARGATLRYDGKSRKLRTGSGCIARHRSYVRAELPGAIRSNALP